MKHYSSLNVKCSDEIDWNGNHRKNIKHFKSFTYWSRSTIILDYFCRILEWDFLAFGGRGQSQKPILNLSPIHWSLVKRRTVQKEIKPANSLVGSSSPYSATVAFMCANAAKLYISEATSINVNPQWINLWFGMCFFGKGKIAFTAICTKYVFLWKSSFFIRRGGVGGGGGFSKKIGKFFADLNNQKFK